MERMAKSGINFSTRLVSAIFIFSLLALSVPFVYGETAHASATVPGAPTSLTSAPKIRETTLTWVAPANNGGSAITDYKIEQQIGSGAWTTLVDGVSTALTFTVTGLTNGLVHKYRVSAINDVGVGIPSSEVNAGLTLSVMNSVVYSITTIESGRVTNVLYNGGTALISPVYGCFFYALSTENPSASVGSVGWATGGYGYTNSTSEVQQFGFRFWTNRDANGAPVNAAPSSCSTLQSNFAADVNSFFNVYPAGTLTPSTQTVTIAKNQAITPTPALTPNAGWPGTLGFTVSPALPAGLSLNASTGVITGTPSVNQSSATHTITAQSFSGSTLVWDATSTFELAVQKEAPTLATTANMTKTAGDASVSLTLPLATDSANSSVPGTVVWSTSNSSVAQVSGSTLSFLSPGTATITATFSPTDTSTYVQTTSSFSVTIAAQATPSTSNSSSVTKSLATTGADADPILVMVPLASLLVIAGLLLLRVRSIGRIS